MSYSSAWFSEGNKQSLADAQLAKITRILDSTAAKPGDHILEIGSGTLLFTFFTIWLQLTA